MTLSPFDPENFRIDPSRIIETEQGTKVVKTNKTAIETESGPQPAWKETAQKIIESPLASDRAKLFAASLLNRRSKILSVAQLQELERIKEQCNTWVPRAIWEPLAKETAKSDYLNEWEEAFFTTILDEQVKSISPKQMESLEASYKRIHDMNSKEAHSNRPVGFPQAWLKFFDSRTQIAALILTKYWMRKGRRRWRDKHNVAQKKGPDLIVVSDKEAAELGVSPRAKQKILRELTSDGLIALTRRPGESSTIEVLLADAKSSN